MTEYKPEYYVGVICPIDSERIPYGQAHKYAYMDGDGFIIPRCPSCAEAGRIWKGRHPCAPKAVHD